MDEKDYVVEGMKAWGGSFIRRLADLILTADPINLNKIKMTWPEYWETYRKRGEDYLNAEKPEPQKGE
ncbi:MAG: hypothetical protein KGI72_05465 [Patescibacteria group bacterium]|nr:hypothetical protein [Patescibacteria group bacterium]